MNRMMGPLLAIAVAGCAAPQRAALPAAPTALEPSREEAPTAPVSRFAEFDAFRQDSEDRTAVAIHRGAIWLQGPPAAAADGTQLPTWKEFGVDEPSGALNEGLQASADLTRREFKLLGQPAHMGAMVFVDAAAPYGVVSGVFEALASVGIERLSIVVIDGDRLVPMLPYEFPGLGDPTATRTPVATIDATGFRLVDPGGNVDAIPTDTVPDFGAVASAAKTSDDVAASRAAASTRSSFDWGDMHNTLVGLKEGASEAESLTISAAANVPFLLVADLASIAASREGRNYEDVQAFDQAREPTAVDLFATIRFALPQ